MNFNLTNKVIVVTGGFGYLGKSICNSLADEGAIVYITGDNVKDDFKYKSHIEGKLNSLQLDIKDKNSIQNAFNLILESEGKIDVLINNAVYGNKIVIEDCFNFNKLIDGVDGSLGGVYRTTECIIPIFINQMDGGNIINIASMYGDVVPNNSIHPNTKIISSIGYCIGKAGIIQFTKYLAANLGKDKIRVNCISPGAFPNVETQNDNDFILKLNSKIPIGRIGNPTDLNGLIALLSSDSSSYITGQNITIDGGMTLW